MRHTSIQQHVTELSVLLFVIGCVALSYAGTPNTPPKGPGSPEARRATFEVRHELTVTVPQGAQRVRIWFAFPQDDPIPGDGPDPAQQVRDLQAAEGDVEDNASIFGACRHVT